MTTWRWSLIISLLLHGIIFAILMSVKTPKLKVREVPPIKAYMVSMTPKPKPLPVIEKSSGQHAEVPLSEKPVKPLAPAA
ncbi:hypothetical protein [Pseudoalteromonas sp. ASV78]|uniref:hypothetical protein n=1 Tax=Pseudoalteromonas sp. ASV78 TaxID=3397851 RepID=UPI0039FC3A83